MGKLNDLTGQRFGRLTVIKRVENIKNRTRWECKCDCGKVTIVDGGHLKAGNTKSCGCCKKLLYKNHIRIYKIWQAMKQRCYNSNNKNYKNYGERKITICDEWLKFENFYFWAKSVGYDENALRGEYTIDRIDVNGNYEPSNCRFITAKENLWNRRCTKKIEYQGKKYYLPELAEKFKISSTILMDRLKRGWDIEKALNTPKQKHKAEILFDKYISLLKKIIENPKNIDLNQVKNIYNEITECQKYGFYSRRAKK